MNFSAKNIIRALRLPFVSARALPFIFGSLISRGHFNSAVFFLGLAAVVSTHLSSNLINDYADSKSRADWQDRRFFGFFGGSKLIQEGVFTERFYILLSLFFAFLAALTVTALAIMLKSVFIILIFPVVIFLGWAYSAKPLQFSYRRMGEIVIFILFGPVLVMGGYFLQTGIFPDVKSFMLSLPFGLLTTAILYANEVPDLKDDEKAGKFTWAGLTDAKNRHILYRALTGLAFLSIIVNVGSQFMHPAAILSLLPAFACAKAAMIIKEHPEDKDMLVKSSQLTIAAQAAVSVILIIAVVI